MCVYSHAHTCPNLHQLIIIVNVCLFICFEVGPELQPSVLTSCVLRLQAWSTHLVSFMCFIICLVASFFWKHLTLGLVKPGSLHWAHAPILAPGKLIAMTDWATYAWPAWNSA